MPFNLNIAFTLILALTSNACKHAGKTYKDGDQWVSNLYLKSLKESETEIIRKFVFNACTNNNWCFCCCLFKKIL